MKSANQKVSKDSYFSPELFQFLKDLEKNNNRQWFNANKERYVQDVRQPMLAFIEDLGLFLASVSKYFVADPRPSGGSMFRIFRDTRFSKDKSPYKTWVAAKFNHQAEGNDVHAPGFYLHLEVDDCVGGGGLWHPAKDDLDKVRQAIVNNPKDWQKAKGNLKIEGDRLMRPPQGYDPNDPNIEDLKFKDFYSMVAFAQKEVTDPDFMQYYIKACQKVAPQVEFLTRALNLPW